LPILKIPHFGVLSEFFIGNYINTEELSEEEVQKYEDIDILKFDPFLIINTYV
jgi:hypothetical protein